MPRACFTTAVPTSTRRRQTGRLPSPLCQAERNRRRDGDIRHVFPPTEGPVSDQLSATAVTSTRPCSRIAEYSLVPAERRGRSPWMLGITGAWHTFRHSAGRILAGVGVQPSKIPATARGHSNLNATNPYPQSPFEDQGPRTREASRRKSAHQIVVRYSSVTYSPPGSLPAFRYCQPQFSSHNFGN